MLAFKSKSRRDLPLKKRDYLGLNALDRMKIKHSTKMITDCAAISETIRIILGRLNELQKLKWLKLQKYMKVLAINEYISILDIIIVDDIPRAPRIRYERHTFESMVFIQCWVCTILRHLLGDSLIFTSL